MPRFRASAVATALCALLSALSLPAAASLRVVLLPAMTVDGAAADGASLEAVAAQTAREKGFRVVQLDAALAAQAYALAREVQKGLVPAQLSTLNADLLLSLTLTCDKSADAILSSSIKAYLCVYSLKAVRTDTGDVTHSRSLSWTGHGLNGPMAVQGVQKKHLTPALADDLATIATTGTGGSGWDVDLAVSDLPDRERARLIEQALARLPGVREARLALFNRELAKFTLSGEGGEPLATLADRIEEDPLMGLRVVFQTERLLHAAFDFGRAFAVKTTVRFVPPADRGEKSLARLIAGSGPDLVAAALANLDGLKPERMTTGQPGEAPDDSARNAVATARTAGLPAAMVAAVDAAEGGWTASLSLHSVRDGRALLFARMADPDPLVALDRAVRDLDTRYRQALARKDVRAGLGLGDEAAGVATPRGGLEVTGFEVGQVFPSRLPAYRSSGIGTITIRNGGGTPVSGTTVTYTLEGAVVATDRIERIDPDASLSLPVKFEVLADPRPGQTRHLHLKAALAYPRGETYGATEAYAPLVIHRANAIDWNEPGSLAGFVTPEDRPVRQLATGALSGAGPGGPLSPQIERAAAIFDALWNPPLHYVSDPVNTSYVDSLDLVQFPAETAASLSGDCDDLTALLAALYESVGLATAIIVTPSHVLPGVETGTLAGSHLLFGLPASRFVVVDGALFVPVEATAIGAGFATAWAAGARAVAEAGDRRIVFRTRDAWRRFPAGSGTGEKPALAVARAAAKGLETIVAAAGGQPASESPLARYIIGAGTPPSVPDDVRLRNPLLDANLTWLSGDWLGGEAKSSSLCSAGQAEACYNLAVMFALEEQQQGAAADDRLTVYSEAVRLLPDRVTGMLLDNFGLGIASEASDAAAARHRVEQALKQARERLKGTTTAGASTARISIKPVGGRKGRPAVAEREAARLFFWEPLGGGR